MTNYKPISEGQYRKLSAKQWHGRRVILLEPLTTFGGIEYPAGTKATITGKLSGFSIKGDSCPHCGIRVHLTTVSPGKLALIDEYRLFEREG